MKCDNCQSLMHVEHKAYIDSTDYRGQHIQIEDDFWVCDSCDFEEAYIDDTNTSDYYRD